MFLILGAGLSGLSASYHLGHENCLLIEKRHRPFGHIGSEQRDGFTWDQGPHVSFTKHEYVRQLFQQSVGNAVEEIEVRVGNYYHGHWIDHPAQTALHQVPEPLRSACLESFLKARESTVPETFDNYQQWLKLAFGPVFAEIFPTVYTLKYWTRSPADLTTEWIGTRILYPNLDDVKQGAIGPLSQSMHYINHVRYPKHGGYQSFATLLQAGSKIFHNADVVSIDLNRREVSSTDGRRFAYDQLINTLPLPIFVRSCRDVPHSVLEAVEQLACTQLVLVNIAVAHQALRPEHWIYVYDKEKLATRINFVEKLSSNNAATNWSGIQTEVYFSRYRPLNMSLDDIGAQVESELIDMGLIDLSRIAPGKSTHRHVKYVPWANVIFDHGTSPALEEIWQWLEKFGMVREEGDTHPLTNWAIEYPKRVGKSRLIMAGRYAQWKYFWSDDCVLRGQQISSSSGDRND